MLMSKGAMSADWIRAAAGLPEERTTVLVYLDCDAVTLGVYLKGEWNVARPPWDSAVNEDADVLFWRRLPSPSTEMLTPPASGGVAASENCSLVRSAAEALRS